MLLLLLLHCHLPWEWWVSRPKRRRRQCSRCDIPRQRQTPTPGAMETQTTLQRPLFHWRCCSIATKFLPRHRRCAHLVTLRCRPSEFCRRTHNNNNNNNNVDWNNTQQVVCYRECRVANHISTQQQQRYVHSSLWLALSCAKLSEAADNRVSCGLNGEQFSEGQSTSFTAR
jgi:hypothetical protein